VRAAVASIPPVANEVWASEYAVLLGRTVPQLPDETAHQLYRLLGHHLAQGHSARRREARLGLLTSMYDGLDQAEPISEPQYEAERRAREAAGESWPSSSTVSAAYGGWNGATGAALRLSRLGTAAKLPADYSHATFKGPCTRLQLADAVLACREHVGAWPFEQQYLEWASHCRRLARLHGIKDPNLPGAKQIRTLVGDFEHAIRLAERELDRPPRGTERD